MKRRGLCLVIAAPPGAGKTSVSRALLESEADLTLSVSVTTRAARPGEEDGVHGSSPASKHASRQRGCNRGPGWLHAAGRPGGDPAPMPFQPWALLPGGRL